MFSRNGHFPWYANGKWSDWGNDAVYPIGCPPAVTLLTARLHAPVWLLSFTAVEFLHFPWTQQYSGGSCSHFCLRTWPPADSSPQAVGWPRGSTIAGQAGLSLGPPASPLLPRLPAIAFLHSARKGTSLGRQLNTCPSRVWGHSERYTFEMHIISSARSSSYLLLERSDSSSL